MGSGKVSELRTRIESYAPHLIQEKKFYLGTLTNDRNWAFSHGEVVELSTNLITYALVRDIFREELKEGRGQKSKKPRGALMGPLGFFSDFSMIFLQRPLL